mgnify:CR=1 FL=1
MLNIALPKGRLGDQVYELLASVGYDCKSIYDENRKLVFENPQTGVRYLLVKPSDVAIYVEHHAADVGIVGKDILMESNPDVYELLDLGLGKCRMCVAGKEDYVEDKDRPVRVATPAVCWRPAACMPGWKERNCPPRLPTPCAAHWCST